MKSTASAVLILGLALTAHAQEETPTQGSEQALTLGIVQRDVHTGMPIEEVALALGSPNIVTRDIDGNETWIYDRIATELRHEHSSKGLGGGGLGSAAGASFGLAALIGAHVEKEEGVSTLTQRSLTVVIKLDADGRVASFSYRTSRF